MTRTMPVQPQYLRASVAGRPTGIDRKREVLQGYTVAQEGPFKSEGRGEFDVTSLNQIISLGNAARGGLKSRFTHPDMSSDGLGKMLGRAKDFSMSTAKDARTGKIVKAVRADLHFDPSAHETPSGDLSGYIMSLAESDPDSLSSSLVVIRDEEYRLNKDGTPVLGEDGEMLPPLWRLKSLHASDIVDTGDAVDGLLSVPMWEDASNWDNMVRLASLGLDKLFSGQPRDVIEARCWEYLDRYLSRRFPDAVAAPVLPTPRLSAFDIRLQEMGLAVAKLGAKK
jgi:hypothetical protein